MKAMPVDVRWGRVYQRLTMKKIHTIRKEAM
jgi:hypothetical protein